MDELLRFSLAILLGLGVFFFSEDRTRCKKCQKAENQSIILSVFVLEYLL